MGASHCSRFYATLIRHWTDQLWQIQLVGGYLRATGIVYIIIRTYRTISSWWFGTWILFFHSVGNVIIPTDFHSIIFQRGRAQPPTSFSPHHCVEFLFFAWIPPLSSVRRRRAPHSLTHSHTHSHSLTHSFTHCTDSFLAAFGVAGAVLADACSLPLLPFEWLNCVLVLSCQCTAPPRCARWRPPAN